VLLAGAVRAENPPTAPWNSPAFSADPREISAAAAQIKAKQYAKVTVFTEEQRKIFSPNGKYTVSRRVVYRVETKEAIARWGTIKANWSPWRGPRPQLRARVIEPDGSVVELDPKILSEAPVHDQRPELYEDMRSYSGPLPGVEVGSIVEAEEQWAESAPANGHGGAWRYYLGDDGTVLHTLLELQAPSSMVLKYKVHKSSPVTIRRDEKDGITTVRFEQGPTDAVEPAERDLPADFELWAAIDYGTGESWSAVASGYYQDIESAIRPGDARSLLEGTGKLRGRELLRQVVTNLHKKVRYTGLEFGSSELIPHPAGDTLKSGYGDCKDKAVVLISALKAAGIPAQLALLYTRGDDDVTPDVPGIGLFDHAIVYVPGKPSTWIDATAEFYEPGDLPWVDQGRLALLVGPDTKELVRIPMNAPSENTQTTRREFVLSEYGPAHIVETFEGTGNEAAILRSQYGQEETKEAREELARYVKDYFLAEDLTGLEHTAGTDLTRSFELKLEIAKGKRGSTDLDRAVAAIRLDGLMWGYPTYVLSDDGMDKPDQPGWKPRKNDIEMQPFATEWRYRIVPPVGFDAPVLPKDSEQALGPAKLTQHYALQGDGSVTAVLRFESGKARYSPGELKAFQQAAHALDRADAILIAFPQTGATLLAQGKAREALASYEALIKRHPTEGLHHIQMANALLAAGFGEEARKEATLATELDPKNADGWSARGWILEHDAIGRRFGSGFDLKGAVAAYRKAVEVDPKAWANYADLAILLEFDSYGQRYSAASDLDGSAAEYRALKEVDKDNAERFSDNLLYVLLYRRKWDEVLDLCDALPSNANRTSMRLAIAAARDGSAAALTEATRRESKESARSDLLVSAANMLFRLRKYAPALDLLQAAAAGQADSSKLRKRIELVHDVRPYEEVLLPESDPRRVVQNFILRLIDKSAAPQDVFQCLEVEPGDRKDIALSNTERAFRIRRNLENQDIPPDMTADILLSKAQVTVDGNEELGYRIRTSGFSQIPWLALVARRPAGYRIIALDDLGPVGSEVLRRLAANDLKGAKQWLDWTREELPLNAGDDPAGGRDFPRFWTRGDDADAVRMKLAAVALLSRNSTIREHLDFLKAARSQARESEELRLDLLLSRAAITVKDWKLLKEAGTRLLAANPGSDIALQFVVTAGIHNQDWETARKAIAARFARISDDLVAIRMAAFLAEAQGNFAEARKTLRPLIDNHRAEMHDFNQYTWEAIFLGKVTDEDLSILQSAINDNSYFPEIHTLACLYAEVGKTKEARELLLRAMDSQGIEEPNEEIWYGFGRIAEDYGLSDVARVLYRRVADAEDAYLPSSTYNLARSREKALPSQVANGAQ